MSAVIGMQEPRIKAVPAKRGLSSRGQEAVDAAERAGLFLDEWQQDVLEDACLVRKDGTWAAFEVGVNVTRQNGKGGILEARELAGLFAWGERLLIHSAHQFDTSLEAFRRLLYLIEEVPEYDQQVKRVSRSHGDEGIELKSGQRIRYRTRTGIGGRGFSADTIFFDEAMVLALFSHGALIPTLSARPNPQVWYTGSAVDQEVHRDGLVFSRVRERAIRGDSKRLVYFEWSLPYDSPVDVPDEVAADPEQWAVANPAYGIRVTEDYVQAEIEALDPRSFAVERLGVGDYPDTSGVAVMPISPAEWAKLRDPGSEMLDPVCLAFDVSPERTAAIAAAGRRRDGLLHVEITDHRPGTAWLAARLAGIFGSQEVDCVVYAADGPAASMAQAVEDAEVPADSMTNKEHVQACGQIVDLVNEGEVRHLGSLELAAAIRGARTRPLGDAWAWSRKASNVDISPLVAATLALSKAAQLSGDTEVTIY